MKRLLVVEDDQNTLRGLEDLLRNDGYWVTGVTRGHQALSVVTREHIDVVLCDYKLPDIDGLQVCGKLRKLRPHLALFMLTAYNNAEIIRGAKECGVQRVFQKPLDLDELFRTLFSLSAPPPLRLANLEGSGPRSASTLLRSGTEAEPPKKKLLAKFLEE